MWRGAGLCSHHLSGTSSQEFPSDATKYLVEVLQPINEVEQSDCLDRLLEHIQKQPPVHECNSEQAEDGDNIFTVIDAFDVPRYTYSTERKKFILDEDLGLPSPCLHGNAETKADLYRERYTILHQRTSRHELFTPPAIGVATAEESKKFKLRPVEYLLGSTTRLGEIIVLGMLTQLKEGKWYLEDPSGAVQLDLSKAISSHILLTYLHLMV
ncbi:hypothetical protein NP493_385g04027 [Ridgeia piscesae]|uniref:DNA polymerase epsilon subunit B N-terminal domain-containing protein n=1 Tax=Ridgeia piscesae TaxID=27915 RepID=A0AAD9NV11_RIDPI|nr:hypothetical protein NP493_385g04027 [Ridgeia piscesae]